jgi:hypothetical protein
MIDHSVYKLIHFVGVFLVLAALGGVSLHVANGGSRDTNRLRRLTAITHGIGLFIILLGGFGLLARLGIAHGLAWPGWVWTKLGIWLLMGVLIALLGRYPVLGRPLLIGIPLLAGIAAYLAIYKPF